MSFYTKSRYMQVILLLFLGFLPHITFANQLVDSNTITTANPPLVIRPHLGKLIAQHNKQQPLPSLKSGVSSEFNPEHSKIIFQVGGFSASQGNEQDIGAVGLISDHFTVAHSYAQNILIGLGYFIEGINKDRVNLMYGLNAFYLAPTVVQGNVAQELLFTNLSYRYSLTNYPIYLAAKTFISTQKKYDITFDLGVGPNIIKTSNFTESALDGGATVPDNTFSGKTSVAFSTIAGIGIKFNNVFGRIPMELGYRFFYLGKGYLTKQNEQLTSTLNTGDNSANSLIISVLF